MRKGLGRHNRRSAGGPQPSLVLDFAGTGTLDPRVTFTRSTTGTYYNSSGVLTTAAINAPRFDFNPSTLTPLGLLIEQSSTNLFTYSQDFSNAVWTKTNCLITSNTWVAPDGTVTGSTITNNSGATNFARAREAITATIGAAYTETTYFKAGSTNYSAIVLTDNTDRSVVFNLSAGTANIIGTGITASITAVGNNVYRCSVTLTSSATTTVYTNIGPASVGNINCLANDYVFAWGAQIEALAFPTSYIPTTSAQVTRASDNASMTGTNFSSWYNTAEGTLYCKADVYYSNVAGTTVYGLANISNGASNNDIMLYLYSNFIGYRVTDAGSTQVDVSSGTVSSNTTFQVAAGYKVNNFAVSLNGATVVTDSVGSIPTGMAYLDIGSRPITSSPVNSQGNYISGHISKLTYYPTRLTNAQLQALTT